MKNLKKLDPGRKSFRDIPVMQQTEIPRHFSFSSPVRPPHRITSTFGPRWKPNEQRFDFHRGVDYYGAMHDPIFAIDHGEVHRIYQEGNRMYPNGGNTLIIRHQLQQPFPLYGQEITQFYAMYLHLGRILVEQGEEVAPRQQVATMGNSGTTIFTHLHFEIRLQTTCSLEFQRRNPKAKCAKYGFDPHIHPFLFIGGGKTAQPELSEVPGRPFLIQYLVPRWKQDLNRIETDAGVVDFNLREGIDATTTRNLDEMDFTWMKLYPGRVSYKYEHIVYRMEFPRRPAFIQLTDVNGQGLRREYLQGE